MENVVFTQLSVSEIEAIVTKAVEASFVKHRAKESKEEEENVFLNAKEACQLLQVALPTLYRYTSDNVIPHIKKGKKLLFIKVDLLRWLKEGKRKTVGELAKTENFFELNTRKKMKA